MSDNWTPITDSLPDEGAAVDTRIDDEKGSRNEALLVRRGRLWYFADESMYVYYTPTHWRLPLASQIQDELKKISAQSGQVGHR